MLENKIKQTALELGFDLVGIASTGDPALKEAVARYSRWLDAGYGAGMEYLKRHAEIKESPEKYLPGCKSVVCVALLYGESVPPADGTTAEVSLYTRGADYHELMTAKLEELARALNERHGIEARSFVDSKPVFDRFWSWRAGLGWLGKNSVLINRKLGSYLFLGGVFTTAELVADEPALDHCGKCRKCIEACPTAAISPALSPDEGRFLDSNKCIAFHTIENRGPVPESVMELTGRWIAGCDICQNVCPWNDPVTPSSSFATTNPAFGAPLADLSRWTASEFKTRLTGIAMNRMKYTGFLRNVAVAVVNSELTKKQKREALQAITNSAEALELSPGRDAVVAALAWGWKSVLSR